MEYCILILCVMIIIILKFALDIKLKGVFELKKRSNKILERMATRFENNNKICKEILNLVGNESVKIEEDSESNNSLYIVLTNKIIIGKFKQEYMKIQTIAHECIHSTQNKITLWFNFIFSNIFNIYFFIISILTLFNKVNNTLVQTAIITFMAIIQYIVRESLESEAIIEAPTIAKEYINSKNNFSKKEKVELNKEYSYITELGNKVTNFILISKNILKIIIYQIIIII